MQIGLWGGSFDPPHVGHLLMAIDTLDALALDRLLVIPTATQPLKGELNASAADRLAMVERCFAGVAGVVVDPIEIERGGLSYTVDTVTTLRERWAEASFTLLVGEDAAATLPRWREPERLLSMVEVVVLARPGASAVHADGAGHQAVPMRRLATRRIDVSSTEIRDRIRSGRSIRGFVTDAVADYIASTGLYLRDPMAGE
jgi:nicotinate-nucleotide adenylyltransferase